MAGPPPNVKVASPIPNQLFGTVPNLGPAFDNLYSLPTVYQHHTGMPNVLPPVLHPNPSFIPPTNLDRVSRVFGGAWQNVWDYWIDRFRTLQAIPGPGPVPGG